LNKKIIYLFIYYLFLKINKFLYIKKIKKMKKIFNKNVIKTFQKIIKYSTIPNFQIGKLNHVAIAVNNLEEVNILKKVKKKSQQVFIKM
jgi:hypothetical protein